MDTSLILTVVGWQVSRKPGQAQFRYVDRASKAPRVGYWDPRTGFFTATSETRKQVAILSHFPETWENLKKLPGFSARE